MIFYIFNSVNLFKKDNQTEILEGGHIIPLELPKKVLGFIGILIL
jgi:hypothetical protein